ncbi:hypothetical protein JZ751_016590, partial [Albula glossodonta]
ALQLDEAPPTQSPTAVEEGPGGGVPNGLQLCRKEESLAPSTHCETRMEQSQDCGNHRREASSQCESYSSETSLKWDSYRNGNGLKSDSGSNETSLNYEHYNNENGLKSDGCSNETGFKCDGFSSETPLGPDCKPYHSKILQLLSTPRKRSCSSVERPRPLSGPPSSWSTLSGLRVMGSFKKLRSSVLQGIQSRGIPPANQEAGKFTTANQEAGNSTTANQETGCPTGANQEAGHSTEASQHKSAEGQRVCNGQSVGEDMWDDEGEEWEGPQRNSRCSRSIRMAYRVGRIPLLQSGAGPLPATAASPAPPPLLPATAASPAPPPVAPTQAGARTVILSRLSKSTDNLHVFRSPFKRRSPSPHSAMPLDSPAHTIKRTASTSSVAPRGTSPLRVKAQVQKLVSSMTDLSVRQRTSPDPAPASSPSPRSTLSQLHDDYSRRAPCLPERQRQCRSSPARNRASGQKPESTPSPCHTHSALTHSNPSHIDPSHSAPNPGPAPGHTQASTVNDTLQDSTAPDGSEHTEGQQGALCLQTEEEQGVSEDRLLGDGEQEIPLPTDMPSLDSELCVRDTPSCEAPTFTTDGTELQGDAPRRRGGRARPRPLSDYSQLAGRKFSIPEEDVACPNKETSCCPQMDCNSSGGCGHSSSEENYNSNGVCGHSSGQENYKSNGGPHWRADQENQHRKRRPISVIGGGAEEREDLADSRPPVPSHQVPPYRGVSVRLRPCPLSQSTPIGLDRLGHPRLHRILSDGGPGAPGMLDDSVSEEESSFDELRDETPYLQPGTELSTLNEWIRSGQPVYAEALWDHVTMEEQELAFKAGDVIRVLDISHKDWWWGAVSDRQAWLPSSFVRVRVNQEDGMVALATGSAENMQDEEPSAGSTRVQSSEHRDQMRTNVVNEIMNTERVYIKHLRDICEGYLRQCRRHTGMFTPLQLSSIFSNIEEIYRFHRRFLRDLERQYNKEQPHLSQIGSCFLTQQAEFSIYSEYCNNHPRACAELHRLMKLGRYRHFFEACRLLQQMIDISIAGFLLTPVQKICKYPLQLGELLKYTPPEHRDHSGVSDAYEAMKKVACLINERKRRLESIDTIAHWQEAILRWEGDDVLTRSSELIHSGDLCRVLPDGKMQQRVYFLFDHQMVFCKKDVLRRDLLLYRGRLDTDHVEVLDVPDGRHPQLGLSLKNAFHLRDVPGHVDCLFCAKKPEDKQRWMQAFIDERRRVREDQEMGMEITESQRKGAILSARKSKRGKLRSMGYASGSTPVPHQPLHPLHQRHVTVPTSIPQQPVFSLAEPKRKPSHLWDSFARHALFRK